VYESSGTRDRVQSTKSVASQIIAQNAMVLNAAHTLEVEGSDVESFGWLMLEAELQTGTRLYADGRGETTASYSQSLSETEGMRYRHSRVSAREAAILVTEDMTFQGANIDTDRLSLRVGGDLHIESLQDRQHI